MRFQPSGGPSNAPLLCSENCILQTHPRYFVLKLICKFVYSSYNILFTRVAVIAQWLHLRLPSYHPGFKSQSHHLRFYQFIFELYHVEKMKVAGVGPYKNIIYIYEVSLYTGPFTNAHNHIFLLILTF